MSPEAREQKAAMAEFLAWSHFSGLKFSWALATVGGGYVPFEEVLKERPATTPKELAAHIDKVVEDQRHSGELAVVKLEVEDYTKHDKFLEAQNPSHTLVVQENKIRRELAERFKPIAKRKAGWTLLGIKNAAVLRRAVNQSFARDVASQVTKDGIFLFEQLIVLIVRKNRMSETRTAKANKRTKAQRAAAARKGHRTRAKGASRKGAK